MEELVFENDNYKVCVGNSIAPDNGKTRVFQVVDKKYDVVEFEARDISQAIFRAEVVNYNLKKKEYENQFLQYVSGQEAVEAIGQETPAAGEIVAEEPKLPN